MCVADEGGFGGAPRYATRRASRTGGRARLERLMKSVCILLLMLIVAMVGLRFVSAHEGATGITRERMDAMESMARAMKAIRRSLEGNRNSAAIQNEADRAIIRFDTISDRPRPTSEASPSMTSSRMISPRFSR